MTQDRPVLLISDRPDRADRLARGIAVIMPCRVVAVGTALPAKGPIAWVVDVDLDAVGGTAWFEDLCGRMRSDVPCIYLARGTGSRDHAAIAQLGTPIVVPARLHATGVVTTLRNAIDESRRRAGTTPVERKLGTAAAIVGNLFAAASAGATPNPTEADEGTRIVLDTISDIGIRAWLDLIWRHDITVYQHSLSVAGYATAFAAELGFSRSDKHRLAKAALLHDVGKARIPLAILNKPGPLTPDEMAVMRTHAAIGADLLEETGRFEQDVLDVARWHHERLDGSGYPDALSGSAIGDLVRLVSICDVHSALTERRVYRAPLSAREARAIMDGMAGQLDPVLLRAYRPVFACLETSD